MRRAGERHALLLAAAQVSRIAIRELVEADHLQHLAHLPVPVATLDALDLEAETRRSDVNVAVGEEGEALKHHRGVALRRREIGDVLSRDVDLSVGDLFEAADHPQRGGLAAAARAEHGDELAVLDLRVEVDDGAYVAIEGLVDVDQNDVEIGHGSASSVAGIGHPPRESPVDA